MGENTEDEKLHLNNSNPSVVDSFWILISYCIQCTVVKSGKAVGSWLSSVQSDRITIKDGMTACIDPMILRYNEVMVHASNYNVGSASNIVPIIYLPPLPHLIYAQAMNVDCSATLVRCSGGLSPPC
jgi:hypothetical protein